MYDIILLPTYNERENIKIIIPEIFNYLPNVKVLVIDDNSPDQTAAEVKKMMNQYSNLRLLERRKKEGLGQAYKEAIKSIINDDQIRSVITMDADGSHHPKYLKDLLDNIINYDLVVGSRYIQGGGSEHWEKWRVYLSKFGNVYSKILTGVNLNDLTAGFICVKMDLLKKIDFSQISSSGYAYQIEFKCYCINKLGATYTEIPIVFHQRREGESKISNQIITEGIVTPFKIFLERLWKK